MKYIYVRGGDKKAPEVARRAGALYGVRHDATAYDTVHMLDVNWKSYDWQKVLDKIRDYKPVMVVVPDYEHASQTRRVLDDIEQLQEIGIPEILVVPKFENALQNIPDNCIVALSMPAPTYAGYIPPNLHMLKGRKVHLLGGRPDSTKTRIGQAEMIQKLNGVGAIVHSVDGNYSGRAGQVGRWYDGGKWQQTRSKKDRTIDIQAHSLKHIIGYLKRAQLYAQPMLF